MKNTTTYMFGLVLLFFVFEGITAQDTKTHQLINQQITTFFKGLNNKDTTLIKSTLASHVSMKTLLIKADGEQLIVNNIQDFINQVGRLGTLHIEEKISNIKVHLYQPLAVVSMNYEFYVDEELSHTGINLFELAYIEEKWQIIGISDSRQ